MGNIHHITLRAIAQATENTDRVKTALSLFLFGEGIEAAATEGHFGNPITVFQARIKGRNCDRFIELLKSKLPEHDFGRLKNEIPERVDDDCVLHIRFDKQAAYKGTVNLAATADTVTAEVRLKAFPARRERAIEVAEKIFE